MTDIRQDPETGRGDAIRGRLLEIERSARPTPDQAERELRETLRKRLTAGDRVKYAALGFGGLSAALVCGSLVLDDPLPPLTFAALCGIALVGLAWAAFAAVALWRGAVGVPERRFAAGLALAATTGTLLFAAGLAATGRLAGPAAVGVVGCGLGLLLLAVLLFLCQRLVESELRLRRKLLELEYRLALLQDQQRDAVDEQ